MILIHDRPVLGGNASSEIRMWIGGAHGKHRRETGILEEILLENAWRNPEGNWSIWDSILWEAVRFQPGVTLLLDASVQAAGMEDGRIAWVRAWQGPAETTHTVRARLFADCSGDAILAPLTGAEFRLGREAAAEFNEPIEPAAADGRTMGLSCLIQMREVDHDNVFTPPAWATKYLKCSDLPHRGHRIGTTNFWWLELGGEQDSIHDAGILRDRLLAAAFGVWDHIKNHCPEQDARRWALEWVGFLPGKRESRRLVGDHMLCQREVEGGGRFDDVVGYGGWSMDDHHPAGLDHPGQPTIHHKAPSPFGIPYRCLYSRNIPNLFMAGRNISATHAAMSSSRVMATCAVLGQAVGTAAALACAHGLDPRGVHQHRLDDLQQALLDDDCFLPGVRRRIGDLTRRATVSAEAGRAEFLRDGLDRDWDDGPRAWEAPPGISATYAWDAPVALRELRLVFDSDLSRPHTSGFMPCCYPLGKGPYLAPPKPLVKRFRVETRDAAGAWSLLVEDDNHQRHRRLPVGRSVSAVRLTPLSTWGDVPARVFAMDVR